MIDDYTNYIIPIDGRWALEDLYKFPRAFEQVYFAMEALVPPENDLAEQRIAQVFRAYPWRGGYSAVSFYNQLKSQTPPKQRPTIKQIRYASPGIIELILHVSLAVKIGAVVTSVAGSILTCNKVYDTIITGMHKRKLLGLEYDKRRFELSRDELNFVLESNITIANIMYIKDIDLIHNRTRDPVISLKILLSVYRRIRILANYKIKGKADLRSLSQMINDGDL